MCGRWVGQADSHASGCSAEAIEKAVRATNPKSRPDLAATYYRAAMAMQATGNTRLASDYLTRARDTDPQGRRGAGTLRAEAGLIPVLGGSPFRTPPGT
jgi:hypothetical protein